jgi:hypothetical protein
MDADRSWMTSARHCRGFLGLVIILTKILIIISSIGLLRYSKNFGPPAVNSTVTPLRR